MSALVRFHVPTAAILTVLGFAAAACSSKEAPPPPTTPTDPGLGPVAPGAAGAGATQPPTSGTVTPGAAGARAPIDTPTGVAGSAGPTTPVGGAPAVPTAGAGSTPTDMPTTPTTPGVSEWATMGYDQASTYNNTAETKLTRENVANLKEIWTAQMGGNVLGAALMVGDKIYATAPGSVRAFEAATGTELWQTSASSSSSLAYAGGTLYLHTTGSQILALNAEDGSQLWMKPVNTEFRGDGSASPLIIGESIIIGGSNGGIELGGGQFRGHLAALDRMTGDQLWLTYTVPDNVRGASMWSSPSGDLEAGVVYGSTGNNYGAPATDTSDSIIQFDLKTGEIKWKAQRVENDAFGGGSFSGGPDFDFGANPVLYETMVGGVMTKLVGAGAKSGAAHAMRRDTGELVWTRQLCEGAADGSSGIFTNSAWSGKNMIFGCNDGGPGTLYALDGATGEIAWMRALPGQVWGRTAIANGVGFVGTGTTLEAFDVETGAMLKSIPSKGGTVASTITVANGRVAFGEGLSWSGGRAGRTLTVLSVE